jgi:iron complex transport system permease protein
MAFSGGIAGVGLSLALSGLYKKSGALSLILGGIISAALFGSASTALQFLADPERELPQLVYWLMGSLSKARLRDIGLSGPFMLLGAVFLSGSGKTVNALSQGREEAMALGINYPRARIVFIAASTLVCSFSVLLAGIVMWVGLVVPHAVRLFLGANNMTVLPASALSGALFVHLADTLARNLWTVEFPLGIFTSAIGLPVFCVALWAGRDR